MDTKTLIKVGMVFADYPQFFSRSVGQRSSAQLGGVMVDLVKMLRDTTPLSEKEAINQAVEIIHESNWILDWSDCEEAYYVTKRRGEIYHAVEMGSCESPSGEW